ncbi:MAG TPA: FHA domain-containing protein [Proteobacteria bacterium]|nr:FHA domain-containing protein [Pseudomonadota bacterium]
MMTGMGIGKMRIDVYKGDQYLGGYHVGSSSQLRIGRGRKNQIILPHQTVSRHHANLVRQGARYTLMDRSSNGTWIEGERIEKAILSRGDEFTIGPYQLRLTQEESEWDKETEIRGGSSSGDESMFEGMVGRSEAMTRLFEMIDRISSSGGTALIMGETGCGKELVARALHNRGGRSSGPFVAINCGAISRDLVESELFGHEKGAFTGASSARKGAFEQAHGGTLFLDEIGELSLSLQPKLLRVLESGEIRRVGSQGSTSVDVRVVAATHRHLKKGVEQGTFRADLLYRLFVLPLSVPSLRQRKDDIPVLAQYFLMGRSAILPDAMERLEGHTWPGNVRELKNVLERACILKGGGAIDREDLIFMDDGDDPMTGYEEDEETPHTLEELERMYYTRAMERSEGNIRAAAKWLGIPKSTFFDRVKKYGISQDGKDEDADAD